MNNCLKISFVFSSCLILLCGCSSKNDSKILRTYHEDLDSFVYVNKDELISLHNYNKDFILFLYNDCGCSEDAYNIIKSFQEYIKETKTLIYIISKSDYIELPTNLSDVFPIYPNDINSSSKSIPTLYFYKNGYLKHKVNYTKFSQKDDIKPLIDKYTYPNGKWCLNDLKTYEHEDNQYYFKIDYTSTKLLDKSLNKDLCILYTWQECSDCLSLKEYERILYEDFTKKLYYFEVDYFRKSDNKQQLWDDSFNGFPYKYDFANYRGGKVPTIVTYNNSKKVSMIVYHNDVIENSVIKESFFEELIGENMSQKDIDAFQGNKVLDYIRENAKDE